MFEINDFGDFEGYVICNISNYLSADYKDCLVEVKDTVKTNDRVFRTLMIKNRDSTIAPAIYLNNFYEEYKKGKGINTIMKEIAELRMNHNNDIDMDFDYVRDWEKVKDKIVPKVINMKSNDRLLRDRPYTELCDLAVTYYILLDEFKATDEDAHMSIAVSDELFRTWDISLKELHNVAVKNMNRLVPLTFKGLGDVLGELLGDDSLMDITGFINDAVTVISNKSNVHGAMALTDNEFMNRVHNAYGKDFYVIPSSVHECLCVPVTEAVEPADLVEMIKQVNDTEVRDEDLLSYNLYRYNPELGLQIVRTSNFQVAV